MDFAQKFWMPLDDKDVYQYIARMNPKDRKLFCLDEKYRKICKLVEWDKSYLTGHSLEGVLPILESFNDFDTAVNFIERFKPGFKYSKEYDYLVEHYLVEKEKILKGVHYNIYKLGDTEYRVGTDRHGKKTEEYYRNGELDRENEPARVVHYPDGYIDEEWYRDGQQLYYLA